MTHQNDHTFAEPQVREGGFYPAALEKGLAHFSVEFNQDDESARRISRSLNKDAIGLNSTKVKGTRFYHSLQYSSCTLSIVDVPATGEMGGDKYLEKYLTLSY